MLTQTEPRLRQKLTLRGHSFVSRLIFGKALVPQHRSQSTLDQNCFEPLTHSSVGVPPFVGHLVTMTLAALAKKNRYKDFPKIDAGRHTIHFIGQRIQARSTIGTYSNLSWDCNEGVH